MNNLKKQLILSCAAIGLSSAALMANAQDGSWASCKDQTNKAECRAAHIAKFKEERDAREAQWHTALKITGKQEPAWQEFVKSMHPRKGMNVERGEKMSAADKENMSAQDMSAPQRMEKRLARMEKHQAAMKARLAALKKLYVVLTPEQQATMNKQLAELEKSRHHRHGQDDDGRVTPTAENTGQIAK